jgi:mono/diheme cytochrome c family protein
MRGWGRTRTVSVAGAGLAAITILLGFGLQRRVPSEIARGHTLYVAHCARCHGMKLEGEPDWQSPKPNGRMPAPPHDASGHTWHHSDRELFLITKKGVAAVVPGYESDMPAFESAVSDEEIAAILAYIKSTWPNEARRYQEERSRSNP